MTKKIAIVDDEPDICHTLKAALEARDFEVVTAGDGIAGKKLIEQENPDLLVCDIKMPHMSGYELIAALKQSHRFVSMPIIVLTSLTGDSPRDDESWRRSMGVAGFLSKPFEPRELTACVERILETCPSEQS